MYKNFLCLFLFLFIVSCNKETKIVKTIKFNVGFNITNKYSGEYYDKTLKKNLIFFSDPMSKKVIKFFTADGDFVKMVDLKEASDYLINIADIAVISSDTIILNSKQTNRLAFVNSSGKVWKNIDLNLYVNTNKEGNIYELYSSSISSFLAGDNLLFFSEWRDNIKKERITGTFESFSEFYLQNFSGPYFFKVSDLYSDKIKTEFGLKSFYSNFSKEPAIYLEPPHFTYENNTLFILSVYLDKLCIIDPNDFKVKKIINIKSDVTQIGANPFPLTEHTYMNLQELNKRTAVATGYISRIYFDKEKKKYYVLVYTADKGKNVSDNTLWPFTVITLDEKFNKLDEAVMPVGQVLGTFSIMTENGLMFYSNKNSNDRKSSEKEFVIYNI